MMMLIVSVTLLYLLLRAASSITVNHPLPPLLGSIGCRNKCLERRQCKTIVYDTHWLRCTLECNIKDTEGRIFIKRRIVAHSGKIVECREQLRGEKTKAIEYQKDVRLFLKGNKFCNLNGKYGFILQKASYCFASSEYACRAVSGREFHKGVMYSWPMRILINGITKKYFVISSMLQTIKAKVVAGFHVIAEEAYNKFHIRDWTDSKKRYVQGWKHNGTLSILLRCELSVTNKRMSIYDMTNRQVVMTTSFASCDENVLWLRIHISGACNIQVTFRYPKH